QSSHSTFISSIFLLARPPPTSTLFPYTTLFRSELQLPEALFIITKSLLIFDHRLRSLKIVVNAFLDDGLLEDVYAQAAESINEIDRKSTRLNSSHLGISYAVFCLKKKTRHQILC